MLTISTNELFQISSSFKRRFTYEINNSPQEPDANNTDIVPIPFHIDVADYRYLETNV